ncbi:MAG: hypothetical protein M3R13_00040 [Armatimonadota bacterium]|nr:hypothetical protein [Armatimonadota bacterium]
MELPIYAWALPLLGLPVLYLLWVAARRVVRWGFFAFYALVGTGLSYVGLLSVNDGRAATLPYCIAAGVSFACVCSAIRARIARVVGILFVAAVVAMIGWQIYWQR